MSKKVVLLLLIVFTLSLISFALADEETIGYQVIIEDNANLLSEEEKSRLQDDMAPLTQYGNAVFLSTNYNSTSQHNYAHDYYYPKFGEQSGSVFLVDMQNRYIYIYSDGANLSTITRAKAEIITDNVYRYASNGNWYGCASNAFKQMNSLLSKKANNGSSGSTTIDLANLKALVLGDTSGVPETMKYVSNILIALVLAFFGTYIYVLKHSKVQMPNSSEILKNCKIKFEMFNSTAEQTGERRVYSPVSDSSSSSRGGHDSGGHGSHSSHSSGGGGGHRF